MAENNILNQQIFAVCWDGTGFGIDGKLWGGEFLIADYRSFERIFYFDYFKLPGGEKAVKEPRRVALSLLFDIYGNNLPQVDTLKAFSEREIELLYKTWSKNINSPQSSSVGRLFDAVSSLLNIKQVLSYEGQSGMIMENLYSWSVIDSYPFEINGKAINWRPIIDSLINDNSEIQVKISRFINTLAEIILKIYKEKGDNKKLGLTGGVFQNKFLVEKILQLANKNKIPVLIHRKVPPNDGGLSLGQIVHNPQI